MTAWIIGIVVVIVVAILILTGSSPMKAKTREDYLEELRRYLEGQLTPLTGDTPGYQVAFNFEGRDFIFEDIEQEGFQEKVHKAFLKTKINSPLAIRFTEGTRMTIRSTLVQVSDIKDNPIEQLSVPKELQKFKVTTNDIEKTNALFDDPKISKLFVHYFNTGLRGDPMMALRIQDDWLSLEFCEPHHMRPNLFDLMQAPAKIEHELFNMITLANTIEALPKNP